MNPHTIRRLFPNASKSIIDANAQDYAKPHADCAGTIAKLEYAPSDGPLATGEIEKEDTGRISIRIVSVRKRLCDEDNLSEKALVDCLRYCGAIPQDSPETVGIQTTQRKAAKGEAEHTQITITYP